VVKVRGAGGGRVSIAGVACYRPGDRPHRFYQLRVYCRRKGEAKGFTWADYRDLILAIHRALSAPLVPSAVCRCSLVAVAAAGLLLPERFSRCCPQPGYRSGGDQG
jgi:hypothetical protein